MSPDADLLLDKTLNLPKSYSIAALLNPELAPEFKHSWNGYATASYSRQTDLHARRGLGELIREGITHVEVVELQHPRSRALDPHPPSPLAEHQGA